MLQPKTKDFKEVANGRARFKILAFQTVLERENCFTVQMHLKHCTTGRTYIHVFWVLRRITHPLGVDMSYELFFEYYKNDIYQALTWLQE